MISPLMPNPGLVVKYKMNDMSESVSFQSHKLVQYVELQVTKSKKSWLF